MFSKLSNSMFYIWGIFLSDTQEQKRDSLWSTYKDAWYCAYSGFLPSWLWITTPSIWVWGWASLFQVTANTVQLKTITAVKKFEFLTSIRVITYLYYNSVDCVGKCCLQEGLWIPLHESEKKKKKKKLTISAYFHNICSPNILFFSCEQNIWTKSNKSLQT